MVRNAETTQLERLGGGQRNTAERTKTKEIEGNRICDLGPERECRI